MARDVPRDAESPTWISLPPPLEVERGPGTESCEAAMGKSNALERAAHNSHE